MTALQYTSVTAWDFGIARLNAEWANGIANNLEMQGFGPYEKTIASNNSLWVAVVATQDNKGLKIAVHLGLKQNHQRRTKGEFQRNARKIIDQIRKKFGTDQSIGFNVGIGYCFVPLRVGLNAEARPISDQLEKVTTIEISSYDENSQSVGTCTAPLAGKEFTCKE